MPLHIFNTLSGKVEEFRPQRDNTVRMYSCGPTVYDYGHIGNFRTFVAVDILRRFLRQGGYKLEHVMNITDVDDRIIERSAQQGVSVREYTEKYERAFFEDFEALRLEKPEKVVRATDNIPQMAGFIAALEKKGFAYRTEDGSYYFRIAKFPEYGKLSKKDFAGMEVGARVDSDRFDKEEARDFALWKAPKPGEAKWETILGPGRPGWHIECSVMAMEFLGETLDLHGGGEDLIFPHHENEIAQSESLTSKQFARFWFHVRFLLVEGEKMSKSLGNFYTLRDLLEKGHKPAAIRYLLASVPYRRQLNFTFDGLKQATVSVERLRNFRLRLDMEKLPEHSGEKIGALARETSERITTAMRDDLNTAEALGALFEMVREANAAADAGQLGRDSVPALVGVLRQFDEIFDVLREDAGQVQGISDAEIETLIEKRAAAKRGRDFAQADALRKQLAEAGVILEDTKDGVRWKRH